LTKIFVKNHFSNIEPNYIIYLDCDNNSVLINKKTEIRRLESVDIMFMKDLGYEYFIDIIIKDCLPIIDIENINK